MPGQTVLQKNNIKVVFDSLDRDHDGKLELNDFEKFVSDICNRTGVSPDSQEGQQLSGIYHSWWQRLQNDLDTDHDGSVSREEFASGFNSPGVQQYFSDYSKQAAKAIAGMLDTDKDGQISKDEYVKFAASFAGLDRATAADGFAELDANGDGKVSVNELQAGWHQMMNSSDPSAAGTALLGQR